MGRRKALTGEQAQLVIDMAKAGVPRYRIAEVFGLSPGGISAYVRNVGGIKRCERRSQAEIEKSGDISKNSVVTSRSGEFRSIFKWAEMTGVNPQTILGRMMSGMDIDEAVSPRGKHRGKTFITASNGQSASIAEWSRITGINQATIHTRYSRAGWTPDEALGFAPAPYKKFIHEGRAYSVGDLARISGAHPGTIKFRMRKDMPFEKIIAPPLPGRGRPRSLKRGSDGTQSREKAERHDPGQEGVS